MEPEQDDILTGQPCPFCHENKLTMTEREMDIPYFGRAYLFSMSCEACKYHKADVECAEQKPACRYTLEISCEEDLKIRIVKSSEAFVKLPHLGSIEPGTASNGYVTNVEGILNRMKNIVEQVRDSAEEEEDRKKAKNILKKITRVMWGQEKQKLIIEDKTGNSAIISDKAQLQKI